MFIVDFVDAVQEVQKVVELLVSGETKKINVEIPAGIKDGEKIRFNRRRSAGVYDGAAGDLFVQIKVKSHRFLLSNRARY